MIRKINSMPRADSSYPDNFWVNSLVFEDDESNTEAKTNSRHWVCPLLVGSLVLACTELAQRLFLACSVSMYTQM